ncbi:MAG: helix-turn-helix transcriptional regulator [Butyrivibrio sp.]|nr:helix-turn-helix transcriptional regulator [Butyrivibrio sp.]
MDFQPDRLVQIRQKLGINKSEAAKRLNMSAMGYGRYENGQRTPSYQTISFIAQAFNTSPEYLCGIDSDAAAKTIVIDQNEAPELFGMLEALGSDSDLEKRILSYYNKIKSSVKH